VQGQLKWNIHIKIGIAIVDILDWKCHLMGVNSYRAMGPFGVKVYVMLVCQSRNFH